LTHDEAGEGFKKRESVMTSGVSALCIRHGSFIGGADEMMEVFFICMAPEASTL
jgi:hypothetical protein